MTNQPEKDEIISTIEPAANKMTVGKVKKNINPFHRLIIKTVLWWTLAAYFILIIISANFIYDREPEYTLLSNPIVLLIPAVISGFIIAKAIKTAKPGIVAFTFLLAAAITFIPIFYGVQKVSKEGFKGYTLEICFDENGNEYSGKDRYFGTTLNWATFGLTSSATNPSGKTSPC